MGNKIYSKTWGTWVCALALVLSADALAAVESAGLTRDEVSSALQGIAPKIIACRESAEKEAKTWLNGEIRLDFSIAPDGKASHTKLTKSTIKTPSFKECVVDAVTSSQFPTPRGNLEVKVSYPFKFR